MAKSQTDMESLARPYAREEIETLIEILREQDVSPSVRSAAVDALIAHGWITPPRQPGYPTRLQ